MTTALEIINAAAENLNIKAPEESLSAEDAATSLRLLNRVLSSYSAYRVYLGEGTLELDDTVDIEDKYLLGLESMLAVRMASPFRVSADAQTQSFADGFDTLVKTQLGQRKALTVSGGLL